MSFLSRFPKGFALLVCCGYSIPGTVAQSPAPTPAVYNVVYLGDSITAGATLPPGAKAPPELSSGDLSRTCKSEVYFSNQGHSGHTTVDFLPSQNEHSDLALGEAAAASLQAAHPGRLIFSVMLGTNDSAVRGPNGAPVSAVNYRMNLEKIVKDLLVRFPDARVVLNEPTWYSPNTQNSSLYGESGLRRLETYPPSLDAVVANFAVSKPGHVYVGDKKAFSYFQSTYRANLTPENGPRGTFYLHPNPAGATKLAEFWSEAIVTAIKSP